MEPCEFLPWDTNFFGQRIARVKEHKLNQEQMEEVLRWCLAHSIECIYFLADAGDFETLRLAVDYGFRLVDIRVELQCDIKEMQAILGNSLSSILQVRYSRQSDIPALQAIARYSYVDSRFYFDPCFPLDSCEAFYETWIKNSCEGYADLVLVAEMDNQPVGYVSCHTSTDAPHGHIGLLGVASQARGHGVGQRLMGHALRWFAEQGAMTVSVVTQGRNVEAQRLYQRCGFLTDSVRIWYHKWMPDCTSR